MKSRKPPALLSLIGVMLLWPSYVFTKSFSSSQQTADGAFLIAGIHLDRQGEERPHVVKRSTKPCDSSYDNYCMNNGQCMLVVDVNEYHCKCEAGFYGHRCANMELVIKPMREEQIIVTVFCVCLLIIGLSGLLYFCCKWYKKRRFSRHQKRPGYKGVQTV